MKYNSMNPIALITGGASGIGFAIANKIAEQGMKIALIDQSYEKLESALKNIDGTALLFTINITKQDEPRKAVPALESTVISTPMVEALPKKQIHYMTSKIPEGRLRKLEEAANLVAFDCSPENSFTTGYCYDLSGGRAVY
ncbi:MAG: SDR family oxidoreductase [Bacteroidetes bacterium]|nr:SDR family oxidoreductase [Bacteroidota bacterium]